MAANADAVPSLHRTIAESSGPLFRDGHYDAAVFEAFKAVEDRVKRLSKRSEIGKRLMTWVFNENAPTLVVTSPHADEDQGADEREGYKFLFMGATLGIRNPRGHGGPLHTSEIEAAEMLGLASLLMRALDRAEEHLALHPSGPDESGEWDGDDGDNDKADEDDENGALDLIVEAEDAMPQLQATVESMAICLGEFGSITRRYGPRINESAQSSKMADRLVVIRALAEELKPPAQKFLELSAEYVEQLTDINGGMDAITHLQPMRDLSIDDQAQYLFLANQVRILRDASAEGVAGADQMSKEFQAVAKLSKALKKPSADLYEGVRKMESVQHYYDEWVDGFRDMGVWEGAKN